MTTLAIIWAVLVACNVIWAIRIYNVYFGYAHKALKKDWEKGFNQSQDWFWDNDLLCVQSILPFYWFWRCRKAQRDLESVIRKYPL